MPRKLTPFIFAAIIGVLGLVAILGFAPIFEGQSMEPTYTGTTVLYTTPLLNGNLTGQVVVYRSDAYDFAIAHRVVSDDGVTVTCKGDNSLTNPLPDAPISKGNIEGVVYASSDVVVRMLLIVVFGGLVLSPIFVFILNKIGW